MNRRYIGKEIAAVLLFGICTGMLTMLFTAGLWWLTPGGELLALLIGFIAGVLIGALASIHDDWKVSLRIERRRK